MRIIIGDEVGQAKVLTTHRGHDTTLPSNPRPTTSTFFPPSRSRTISHLLSPLTFQSTPHLAAALSTGGHLRIFSPSSSPSAPEIAFTHTIPCAPETRGITLCLCSSADGATQMLCAAVETGQMVFVDLTTGEVVTCSVPGEATWEYDVVLPTNEVRDGVPVAVVVARKGVPGIVVFQGREMKRVWSSKAPRNDERGLERVVLTTVVEFWGAQPVEGSSSSSASSSTSSASPAAANSDNKPHRHHHRPPTTPPPHLRFLAASTDGCIRIYDTTLSRRAIHTTPISTSPITSFTIIPSSAPSTTLLTQPSTTPLTATLSSSLTIAVSTLSSESHLFSLSSRRLLHSLRGTTGAIQNLCLHHDKATDETLIAGVGNGRYLCVWDQNGKLVVRAFTKTVGTTVAFVEIEDEEEETRGENDGGDQEEEEDVWEGMKVVGEGEEGEKKRKGRGVEEDKEGRRKKVRG